MLRMYVVYMQEWRLFSKCLESDVSFWRWVVAQIVLWRRKWPWVMWHVHTTQEWSQLILIIILCLRWKVFVSCIFHFLCSIVFLQKGICDAIRAIWGRHPLWTAAKRFIYNNTVFTIIFNQKIQLINYSFRNKKQIYAERLFLERQNTVLYERIQKWKDNYFHIVWDDCFWGYTRSRNIINLGRCTCMLNQHNTYPNIWFNLCCWCINYKIPHFTQIIKKMLPHSLLSLQIPSHNTLCPYHVR